MRFKQFFLTEAIYKDNVLGYILNGENNIPLSKEMIDRVLGVHNIICFHATDPNNFSRLEKLQSTSRAISCFTSPEDLGSFKTLIHGVATEGGIIVELEGSGLYRTALDAMSVPDEHGDRWITVHTIYDLKFRNTLTNMLIGMKDALFRKYNIKFNDQVLTTNTIEDLNDDEYEQLVNSLDDNTKSNLIKSYFDGIERIVSMESIKTRFKRLAKIKTKFEYDEVIVSHIKIRKVFVVNLDNEDDLNEFVSKYSDKYKIKECNTESDIKILYTYVMGNGGKPA